MTSKKLDWLFEFDDCQEWADQAYLFSMFEYEQTFKSGKSIDKDILWYAGYLYKHWMTTRKISRQEIYKILPLNQIVDDYDFYSSQDWDFVIEYVLKEKGIESAKYSKQTNIEL